MTDIDALFQSCEFNWKRCFANSGKDEDKEDEDVSLTVEHSD